MSPAAAPASAAASSENADAAAACKAGDPAAAAPAVSISFVWMSAAALKTTSTELQQVAERLAGAQSDNARSLLGRWLLEKGVSVEALATEWDRNKDGDISKSEFRINVKKLGLPIDIGQIDGLFDSFDDDNSGSLEMPELKKALKGLKDEVRRAMELADRGKGAASGVCAVVDAYEAAYRMTVEFEAEETALAAMRLDQSVKSRLGALLKTRNIKMGDVVKSWDTNGDGSVDVMEWRQNIRSLGFKATDDELDAVFNELDDDGSGELDLDECKTALKTLQAASCTWLQQEAATAKRVKAVQKAAKASQYAAQKAQAEERVARQAADLAYAQQQA